MADNKKYYYLKLKEGFFESDELKILQAMPDGYLYSDILIKLYLKSLRNNGKLMYRDVIPYTPSILATLTGHQVGTIEKAIDIFQSLGLVEILDNGAIYIMDIQNFIGQSSTEADRQRQYYNSIKKEKSQLLTENDDKSCKKSNKVSDKVSLPEIRDRDKEIEIKKYICAEQAAAPEPEPIITLPLNTGEEYPLYESDIQEFSELYPAVDILQAMRGMRGWCMTNPTRRKTKRGIRRFVNSWLAREQDKGSMANCVQTSSQIRKTENEQGQSGYDKSLFDKLLNENRGDMQ